MCVGRGAANPSVTDVNQTFFKVNIVIHFNILINVKQTMYPLCLHPITAPRPQKNGKID